MRTEQDPVKSKIEKEIGTDVSVLKENVAVKMEVPV